ncbi:hypothetical protein Rfer_3910 [Rhodoferax ferrireducens T118]|uniref:Uncharacterized protein n=1 Tax=Albidiferax ferrireducens (strain ATCC BAA-621 / DSM 15236 / T118) TaxID=338969 RepID=Q21RJ4_ALBFT|nr:hypothetical protein Rfer_3910 [Rhodoferax ferrireducens T118]
MQIAAPVDFAIGSPGIHVGRGLKLPLINASRRDLAGSPGIHVGRGLKLVSTGNCAPSWLGSPGIHVGRGLKHKGGYARVDDLQDRPAFMSGAD